MSAAVEEPLAPVQERAAGMTWWKWLLGPWMAAVTVAAFVAVGPAAGFQAPEAARIIFFHVPVAMLLLLWFIVGAIAAGRFLRSGNLEFDTKSVTAAEVGLLCTVLATISGSVFAKVQWGTWWNWDPKQVGIVVVMFSYFAYFGLRATIDDRDRRARLSGVYAILAGIAAPFILMGMQYLPINTLHPANVVTTREGMSPDYRAVWIASLIGFLGITTWIYQLRLRLARAEERLNLE